MIDPTFIQTNGMHIATAIARGHAHSVTVEDGSRLVFCPSHIITGMQPGCLLVCHEGRGAVILDDPSHFNKFVFVKAGFSMTVGDLATNLVRAMVPYLNRGASAPLLTDGKEHSHE